MQPFVTKPMEATTSIAGSPAAPLATRACFACMGKKTMRVNGDGGGEHREISCPICGGSGSAEQIQTKG